MKDKQTVANDKDVGTGQDRHVNAYDPIVIPPPPPPILIGPKAPSIDPRPAVGPSLATDPPPPPPAPPMTPPEVKQYYYPDDAPAATTNVDIVNVIADAMQTRSPVINKAYADRLIDAAKFLRVPVQIAAPILPDSVNKLVVNSGPTQSPYTAFDADTGKTLKFNNSWSSMAQNYMPTVIVPTVWVDNEYETTRVNQARSNIFALIRRVQEFASKATATGMLPPDNPFSVIDDINSQRNGTFNKIVISDKLADDLVYSIKVYIDLLDAENQGAIDLKHGVVVTSQLAHIRLSFDGLGGSGNPASDILQFLPDADAIKKKNAIDVLSVIDFSKRTPELLFTMEYAPEIGKKYKGTLIGWRRIPDASGYILRRRDVFGGRDTTWSIDNNDVASQSDAFLQYSKLFATSFMNSIDDHSIVVFFDEDVSDNEYYMYKIQAYQIRSEYRGAIFSVTSSPALNNPAKLSAFWSTFRTMDNDGKGAISPWPAFSSVTYGGNLSLDWILAATNIRASIFRGDDRDTTRSYSYLNADASFLTNQAAAGKLVIPADVGAIQKNIEDAVQKFGVNQTIQTLLDDTGVSYYFEGRDASEDTHFDRAGTESVRTSNLFKAVGAAIDPTTAMLDLNSLASNMMQLSDGSMSNKKTNSSVAAMPSQISSLDGNVQQTSNEFKFVSSFEKLKDPYLDLTTFDGLSKMIRVIRLISDFRIGSNLVTSNVAKKTMISLFTEPQPVQSSDSEVVQTVKPASAAITISQLLDQPSIYLATTTSKTGANSPPTKTALSPSTRDEEI